MCVYCNRSQMTSQRVKNEHDLFFDLLQYTHTEKCYLFVIYIYIYILYIRTYTHTHTHTQTHTHGGFTPLTSPNEEVTAVRGCHWDTARLVVSLSQLGGVYMSIELYKILIYLYTLEGNTFLQKFHIFASGTTDIAW